MGQGGGDWEGTERKGERVGENRIKGREGDGRGGGKRKKMKGKKEDGESIRGQNK